MVMPATEDMDMAGHPNHPEGARPSQGRTFSYAVSGCASEWAMNASREVDRAFATTPALSQKPTVAL
ncbi:hypothetical protein GCM10009099_10380 [Caenispirillum bisanense]